MSSVKIGTVKATLCWRAY